MSEKFTASNGVEVWRDPAGDLNMIGSGASDWLLANHEVALREFFLHEAGLWCDPETGLLVERVPESDNGDGRAVRILGKIKTYWEGLSGSGDVERFATHGAVARYFAAHPGLKAWHSAEPGELWNVKVKDWDTERCFVFAPFEGPYRFQTETEAHIPVTDDRIVSAVRVYPEEES